MVVAHRVTAKLLQGSWGSFEPPKLWVERGLFCRQTCFLKHGFCWAKTCANLQKSCWPAFSQALSLRQTWSSASIAPAIFEEGECKRNKDEDQDVVCFVCLSRDMSDGNDIFSVTEPTLMHCGPVTVRFLVLFMARGAISQCEMI